MPRSDLRQPKATPQGRGKARGVGRALALPLALCLCASVGLGVALPSVAGACARPASVKSFHGHAHMYMALSAGGIDPGLGGMEYVSLSRGASMWFNLNDKLVGNQGAAVFGGKLTTGSGSVADSIENSGSGEEGTATYGGSLRSRQPNYGSAELGLVRRGCKYSVLLAASMRTTYSGDEGLRPGAAAVISASSGPEPIPHSLHLSGHTSLDAYLGCPAHQGACFEFGGTWTTDFATLKLCHSLSPEHCSSDKKPVGSADVSWNFSPIFEKHKHHKKKK